MAQRPDNEQRVDDPGTTPVKALTEWEQFIMSTVPRRIKTIADTSLKAFDERR
jgi:hypothetical protein